MRKYIAFWKSQKYELEATSSYEAQQTAAKHFKAKKAGEVTVMLADVTHDPSVL